MDSRTLQRRFELSRKHAVFVLEYIKDLNGSQAAIRTGYAARTARITAHKLLTNTYILQAVEAAFSERIETLNVSHDDVLRRLVNLAFTDIDAFAEWDKGSITLKPLEDVPVEKRIALAGIESTTQGLRIKMADRMPALTVLARHFGILPITGNAAASLDNARVAYERTVTEKWNLDNLSSEQLEAFGEILRTIGADEASPDASR